MNDCIFCQIASGKIASDIVYEDDDVVAFTDVKPEAPVHILIVPRRHISGLSAAEKGDEQLMGKIILTSSLLAKQRGVESTGYRLVVNTGKQGGQTVDHLHFHLLGGRFMTWPPG